MKDVALNNSTRVFLVALVAGVGMFSVWYSTRWGAGLISDTFQYVASARSFAEGKGFSIPYGDGELEPMTKYPPLFPFLLSILQFSGMPDLQGVRFANIFLFGINVFLVFMSVHRLTHSYSFSLLASFLFSISFVLIEVHSWALSEALYICIGLGTSLALERYFREMKLKWLILSAILAAGAFLARYVGLSLILAVLIVILLRPLNRGRKLLETLRFGFIAVLPIAVWTLRGYFLTATLNDRTIGFHPLTKKNYTSAIDAIFGWFLPRPLVEGNEKLLLLLSLILIFGLLFYLLRLYKGSWRNSLIQNNEIVVLHIVYIFAYGAMIIISKTWVDADIGLSDRMLSPMLVSFLILLTIFLSFLWENIQRTRIVVVFLILGIIAYYLTGTIISIQRFHEGGLGIARRGWNRSETVQALSSFSSFSIYTNSNSSLYLWSERAGYNIKDFELLKEKGTDKKVLLVIFRNIPPSGERLKRLAEGLDIIKEDQIVSIYSFGPVQ